MAGDFAIRAARTCDPLGYYQGRAESNPPSRDESFHFRDEPAAKLITAMQCSDLERDLESLVDGELLASDRLEYERHLGECSGCQRLVSSRRELRRAVREAVSVPCPSDLRAKVSQRLDRHDEVQAAAQGTWWQRTWQQPAVMLVAGALAGLLVVPTLRSGKERK